MRNKFGVCPICGHPLLLLKSAYSVYKISETAWIKQQLDNRINYKGVCKECGYSLELEVTERGLQPKGYVGKPTQKPILNKNIGYIEED